MSLCTIAAVAMITFITVAEGLSPILLVPGLMGSNLYSRVKPCLGPISCSWQPLWLNPRFLLFFNDLKLEYNETSNSYHNRSGVDIKVVGFGTTCRSEYMYADGPDWKCDTWPLFKYYHDFVEYFVQKVDYKRDHTIRAAPYDWRLTPVQHEQMGYYSSVKQLIEKMYAENHNKKVTLVVHSMGGPVTLYFLNNVVDQAWKDKYIHAFVPLAGAWSGGNQALLALVSGLSFSDLQPVQLRQSGLLDHVRKDRLQHQGFLLNLPKTITKDITRTLPGVFLMLPNATVWKDKVLVKTAARDYTANDYEALFRDMGYPLGFTMYSNGISGINADYPAPNVPTYCFYGTGLDTQESFYYPQGFGKDPIITTGSGDGTVNDLSSEVCLKWQEAPNFVSRKLLHVGHMSIIGNTDVLAAVKEIVTSI